MPQFSAVQEQAMETFALGVDQWEAFVGGVQVATDLHGVRLPIISVVQRLESRMRCGIVLIHDPGGGVDSLARFRANAVALARAFECQEVELFGAAIINDGLRQMLLRQGFEASTGDCPEELGDESWEILSRVYSI
jgi:hypothetical protein